MKTGYTHLAVVLDASGSMGRVRDAAIEGFNKLIEEQKKVPGECTVQIFTFNGEVRAGDVVAIGDLPPLTRANFKPKGNSALHDAIATAIDATGATLSALAEEARPDKVVLAVVTDGMERGSQRFTREQVIERVAVQSQQYAWFICLVGANMDAKAEAAKLGIPVENAIRFTADNGGVRAAFHRLSNSTNNYRRGLSKSMTGAERPAVLNLAAVAG